MIGIPGDDTQDEEGFLTNIAIDLIAKMPLAEGVKNIPKDNENRSRENKLVIKRECYYCIFLIDFTFNIPLHSHSNLYHACSICYDIS